MIVAPYLIQRARIKTPLADESSRLSQAVEFDYMGSAEFEFGALPKSFRRIELHGFDSWKRRVVNDITENDSPLRVWSALSDSDFAEYQTYLARLRFPEVGGRLNTKEAVRFEHNYNRDKYFVTDFWWDIDNDVMFGFNKAFMNRVGTYVANSLKYMNEQK